MVCNKCNRKITTGSLIISYNDQTYHSACFCCSKCSTSCSGETPFAEIENQIYCEKCLLEQFCPTCTACNNYIMGGVINMKEESYHTECFNCEACGKNLSDLEFFEQDNKPYCLEDYYTSAAIRCFSCGGLINGDYSTMGGLKWHTGHVGCIICGKGEREKVPNFLQDGFPMCEEHARASQEKKEIDDENENALTSLFSPSSSIKETINIPPPPTRSSSVCLPSPTLTEENTFLSSLNIPTFKEVKVDLKLTINRVEYKTLSLIHKGKNANVYKVISNNNDIFVAKVITIENPDGLESLVEEIMTWKALQQKNPYILVKLIDYAIADSGNEATILTEYAESTLNEKMKYISSLGDEIAKENTSRAVFQEIIKIIEYLHNYEESIIHQYLEPKVLVYVKGRLLLTGLGFYDKMKAKNLFKYIAAEVTAPETSYKKFSASDIYSVGLILNEMLYGFIPKDMNESSAPYYVKEIISDCIHNDPMQRCKIEKIYSYSFLNPHNTRTSSSSIGGLTGMKMSSNSILEGEKMSSSSILEGKKMSSSSILKDSTSLSPSSIPKLNPVLGKLQEKEKKRAPSFVDVISKFDKGKLKKSSDAPRKAPITPPSNVLHGSSLQDLLKKGLRKVHEKVKVEEDNDDEWK